MSIPATIRAMQAAGAEPELIIQTVLAMEEERLAKGRARQAKYRNNNANRNVTNVVRVTSHDKKETPPKPPKEKTPPEKEKPPTGSKRKRGSRLPSDWRPTLEDREYAASKGLRDIETEVEKFRNYWLSKSGQAATKLDWCRTWQNWVINAVQYQGNRSTGPPNKLFEAIDRAVSGEPIP